MGGLMLFLSGPHGSANGWRQGTSYLLSRIVEVVKDSRESLRESAGAMRCGAEDGCPSLLVAPAGGWEGEKFGNSLLNLTTPQLGQVGLLGESGNIQYYTVQLY